MVTRLGKPANYNDGPSPMAIGYANQFLRYKSILRRADLMSPNRVDGIFKHAVDVCMWRAVLEEGEADWIARSLHPGDLPPTATTRREWLETTGTTSETFVGAARGDGTAIRDDTFIGIYGAQFLTAEHRTGPATTRVPYNPPVVSLRFTVGGTRVAEWDLYGIWRSMGFTGAATSSTGKLGPMLDFPVGIAESPIFIWQNKALLLEYYEQVPTTAADFILLLLGVVVEKRGSTDGLNP